jgi:MFS family permease
LPAALKGSPDRIPAVRRQARPTLAAALAFAVAAVGATVVPHRSGVWLPLHLFLAGSLLLAISGAAQFFAVTWSAGPSPSDRLAGTQRLLLAAGAAGVAVARERSSGVGVLLGGAAVLVALAVLAWALVGTVRPAVQRRFDAALGWYLSALGLGAVGISLGIALGTGAVSGPLAGRLRQAHALCNLIGLVGLVVAGTLPFFLATQAKMRMSPGRHRQAASRAAMPGRSPRPRPWPPVRPASPEAGSSSTSSVWSSSFRRCPGQAGASCSGPAPGCSSSALGSSGGPAH